MPPGRVGSDSVDGTADGRSAPAFALTDLEAAICLLDSTFIR